MKHYINTIKLLIYFFIISFSISLIINISFIYTPQVTFLDMYHVKTYQLLTLGMVIGPIVVLLILNKKGVYNASIFIVYLLESSVVAMGFYNNHAIAVTAGSLALGIAITSSMIVCPILTHYLRGPVSYIKAFSSVLISYFLGFILSNPLHYTSMNTTHFNTSIIYLILLLLISFFTVFSAWKGRLVLLK